MTTATLPLVEPTEDDARIHFEADTRDHQLTVLHDDGLYRHLRFKRPDTGMGWFDLITWPGCLTINGDMGTYTFTRESDMLAFFRASRYGINADYWAEKIRCGAGGYRDHVKEFSPEAFLEHVAEYLDQFFDGYLDDLAANDGVPLWPGLDEELAWEFSSSDLEYEDAARQLLRDFRHRVYGADHKLAREFSFGSDWWEWDLRAYAYRYLWCCHAIVWGIAQYDQHKTGAAVTSRG